MKSDTKYNKIMYKITDYSKKQAKRHNVELKPSENKTKKIDVFKNGKKIASIGAIGYPDYPTYMELEKSNKVPSGTAKKRRAAYKSRHAKNIKVVGSNGWWADKILW